MKSAKEKLAPERWDTSGKMLAILGWIVGREVTDPAIEEFCVTVDGHVFARNKGHVGFDNYFSSLSDFKFNIWRLADVAELTEEERQWLDGRLHDITGYSKALA